MSRRALGVLHTVLTAARRVWLAAAVSASLLVPTSTGAQSGTRYVNPTDPTCGGHSPCYVSIQAAVNAALSGETIQLQAGSYHEQVSISGKNNTANASEADRITIQADPAAPLGTVVVTPPTTRCTHGYALRFRQSKFVTLRGLTITGARGQAVSLLGGNNQNQGIHLERLRIFDNGSAFCDGGITIARGNPGTLVANNLIYGNGRNGLATLDADGGPHYVVGNTIHGNDWNGVSVTRGHEVFLVNNALTRNGTAPGSAGGRLGVRREAPTTRHAAGIHLLSNLICGNRLGEINGPALDGTDAGNLTPSGTEGLGVTASSGCDNPATVYAHLDDSGGVPDAADDDFTPAPSSPAIDRGMDPRTLGLPASLDALLETDYSGVPGVRPKNVTGGRTPRFDIGAVEANVADHSAPTLTFVQPLANAYVRQTVTVQAQAVDTESGVATFGLSADGQALSATLTPTLPPSAASVTATATWATTTVLDGAHTLTASATDRAGNPGSAPRVVIVDNTPPDTRITSGPSGEISESTVTFGFMGSDTLSPAGTLVFAWRTNGGAWSALASATTATLTGLAPGPHTFEVRARDLAGNESPAPAQRTFTVSRLRITITEPLEGATLPAGQIVVRGTLDAMGSEVGVIVNSVPSTVYGAAFAVLVPVSSGRVTITAVATIPNVATASQTIQITVTPTSTPAALLATPSSGVAPLSVSFSPLVPLLHGPTLHLDADGDGTVDFVGPSQSEWAFTFLEPGLYVPRLVVTDRDGTVRTVGTVVQVFDQRGLDTALRARWSALKDALRRGDTPRALMQIVGRSRVRYEAMFQGLVQDLPDVDAILTTLELLEVRGREAIYEMTRTDHGIVKSFEIRFCIDGDGIWRLWVF